MKQEITRKTLEIILKTFEATSSDEVRVNLNGVRLAKDKDGNGIVEATDGHILARHFIAEKFDDEIIIDRNGKTRLKTFLKENKSDFKFDVDFDVETNRNLQIFTRDSRDGIVLPVIFRNYPNTDAVIPKASDDYLEVCFNPSLLTKLYKSMNGDGRTPKVKLKIRKDSPNTSPIMVESGNDNLGIIMPVRL